MLSDILQILVCCLLCCLEYLIDPKCCFRDRSGFLFHQSPVFQLLLRLLQLLLQALNFFALFQEHFQ